MAIVTRVPFGFPTTTTRFSSLSTVSQCHKHSWSSYSSLRVPETSTLFSPHILFLQKRDRKGIRRIGVVSAAMADLTPNTVLVTGAGGRTGSLFFFVCLFGFFCLEGLVLIV
jgi:hypothetical protein